MQPKVTVVMNSYCDDPEQLRQSISSQRQQEGVIIELIISTVKGDRAVEIGREVGATRVVVNDHPGIYSQLNNALRFVTGDWFAYSAGDCISLLTKSIDEVTLCKKSDKRVCYSAFYEGSGDLSNKYVCECEEYDLSTHMERNFIIDSALMHVSVLRKYSPFREEFGNCAFWDFWLRVYEGEGNVFVYNPRPEKIRRVSPDSGIRRRKRDKELMRKYRELKETMLVTHRRNK